MSYGFKKHLLGPLTFILLSFAGTSTLAFDDPAVARARDKALAADVLPAWETGKEILARPHRPVVAPQVDDVELFAPPPAGFRVPAEFEPVTAYIVSQGDWSGDSMLISLITQGTQKGGAGAIVLTKQDPTAYTSFLKGQGVDVTKIRVLRPPNGLDAKWSRDYSPISIYKSADDHDLAFVDLHYYDTRQKDDAVTQFLAEQFGLDRYGLEGDDQSPPDDAKLYLEGGNFSTDGMGTCIMSNDVPTDNADKGNPSADTLQEVEAILTPYLGCQKFIWLDPIPNTSTGHVDMYTKLVTPTDILVIDFPNQQGNNATADAIVEADVQILESSKNLAGDPFVVHRIMIPPLGSGALGWTYRTYTNSVLLNRIAMVPTYNQPQYDDPALEVYRSVLGSDWTVVGIPSSSIVAQGGAVHCTTMQIATACGNGKRDDLLFEDCEGDDLGGATCESLKLGSGTLACSDACRFDTSGCENGDKDAGGDSDTDTDTDTDTDADGDSDGSVVSDGGGSKDSGANEESSTAGGCGCSVIGGRPSSVALPGLLWDILRNP